MLVKKLYCCKTIKLLNCLEKILENFYKLVDQNMVKIGYRFQKKKVSSDKYFDPNRTNYSTLS